MSKRMDTLETAAQTGAGIVIGFGINLGIAPLLGIPIDMKGATTLTAMYVVASFIRSYGLRRLFRWIEHRPKHRCKFCGDTHVSYEARRAHETARHECV